jgi:hypothetical protein
MLLCEIPGSRLKRAAWHVSDNLRDSGQALDEVAHDGRATPSHDQIVRHMGNDGAPRMVRDDTEMVS